VSRQLRVQLLIRTRNEVTPVPTLSVRTWIGNAYAALFGRHGDVTQQAAQAACSRQTVYDHASKVEQAIAQAHLPGPSREQLLEENRQLREENRQLWDWLEQTIDCPEDQQRHFAVHANALGLSLTQTLALLAILLPAGRRPSRATLGRWVNQGARRARRILEILDTACRSLVRGLCLDEIFFRRRPVLLGVEPHSLAWVLGARARDRSGETWAKALEAWPDVEDVAADGGTGIERGLELAAAQRQAAAPEAKGRAHAKPIHARRDTFPIRRDGARALRVEWGHAEALWEAAEKVERAKGRFDRSGVDGRKFSKGVVAKAWAEAEAAFEEACRKERAWGRAVAALGVWRPDGRLNDRAWAEVELQAAATGLMGRHWAKVRRQLQDERALTFLDRLHGDLAAAEPCPERRAALVALWRWRRLSRSRGEAGAAGEVVGAVLADLLQARLGPDWKESSARVRGVLGGVVRASSAVECVNSVVRMHQARHRTLTQELLDLKRLYWNCRGFREGKRRGHCPYQLLGLKLPSYDPWALLHLDPEHLRQQLSSSRLAA
jgi:hypothetical protein